VQAPKKPRHQEEVSHKPHLSDLRYPEISAAGAGLSTSVIVLFGKVVDAIGRILLIIT
jgi:hypothetical protein